MTRRDGHLKTTDWQRRGGALADEIRPRAGRFPGNDRRSIAVELVQEYLRGRKGLSSGDNVQARAFLRRFEGDDRAQQRRKQIEIAPGIVPQIDDQVANLAGVECPVKRGCELGDRLLRLVQDLVELEIQGLVSRKNLEPVVVVHVLQIEW